MHNAMLWEPLKDNKVSCRLCSHYCMINNKERGRCGVRQNNNGELFTLVGETVAALNLDPVEKKPLYHFYPQSRTLSFGTQGCNFACAFCQNADLSQSPALGYPIQGQKVTPDFLVETALRHSAASISYTYSEPTIFFELMYRTAKAAHEQNLKNIIVSNGYQSPMALDMLAPHIDAANIDLKSFSDAFYKQLCGARLEPVLNTLKHIRQLGWWLEITTLLIPEENDSPEELQALSEFIANELGTETPWHISRFHPDYKLTDHSITPHGSLEQAYKIGRKAGLKYVYIGNVSDTPYSDTYCPECKTPIISRKGFSAERLSCRAGKCSHCGAKIDGIGI